jgi:hypothetical protein
MFSSDWTAFPPGTNSRTMRFPLGPVALLAVLGTFLLPFIDFSCQGKQVVTMSGYETAFGKEMTADLPISKWMSGDERKNGGIDIHIEQRNRTEGKPLVAAALIVGVIGGLLGFMRPSLGALGGIGAAVLLLIAQADMQKQVQQRNVPMLVLSFREGFWASLGCAAVGGVLCLLSGRK